MADIIRLEGSVSGIHLANEKKSNQNEIEDVPNRLEFSLSDHVVHFVEKDSIPLKNGDRCIVTGYLHEDIIQTLALKHIETGQVASADIEKLKKGSYVGIVACTLGIIVSLILLSIVGLSDFVLFTVCMLMLIAATTCLWVIKKYVFDEADLIKEAREKI